MERIEPYQPAWPFRNGHVSTAYAGLLRGQRIRSIGSRRRIKTPDHDFLDLDLAVRGEEKLVVLLHGLEGNTGRPYMVNMADRLLAAGYDVLAVNFRGCSGEPNHQLRSYHTGETRDLRFVMQWIVRHLPHWQYALVGFSLGGNVLLKYLGEEGADCLPGIQTAVAFSVPVDLASSSRQLDRGINRLYVRQFLKTLIPKALGKLETYPGHHLDREAIRRATSFREFDQAFTAPVNGFASTQDYWEQASSLPYLSRIPLPVLMVNALDDPFLSPVCYPGDPDTLGNVRLESPAHGGHVAFPRWTRTGYYWSEERVVHHLNSIMIQRG